MERQDEHGLSDIIPLSEKEACFARSTYIYVISDVYIPLIVVPVADDFMSAVPIAFKFRVAP